MISSGGRDIGAWGIGFALGLFVLNGVGLLAVIFGWDIAPVGYGVLFFLSATSVPAAAGSVAFLNWIENIQLDTYERRQRIRADAAGDAAVTLTETNPFAEMDAREKLRAHAIQVGLIDFILWSMAQGGKLISEAHVGYSVRDTESWMYWTDILAENRWAFKTNGVPTTWEPSTPPGVALLKAHAGKFILPAGDKMPPPVTPCPNAWVTVENDVSAKAKGRKGAESLQKAA